MGRRLQILLAIVIGVVAGVMLGGTWLMPLNEPPDLPHLAGHSSDAKGLAGPATPTDADLADLLAGRPARRQAQPAAPAAPPSDESEDSAVLVPSNAAAAVVEDASLVVRGPGHYALLDLAAAGVGGLNIRQGAMVRDGDGRFTRWAKKPKVGRLSGRQARVELLHLGFDAEGQPTVAHIRTVQEPFVEGVVSLFHDERYVPVRSDRSQRPADAADEHAEQSPSPDAS